MILTDAIDVIKNVVTIIATIIAAVVAILGLKAWKKQLKGKTEYELARRFLIAVYKYREAFAIVRNPAIFTGEAAAAEEESEDSKESDKRDPYLMVYYVRWRKVSEVANALRVELLEAEVVWGKEIKEIVDDLIKCETKLFVVVRRHVEGRSKDDDNDILYDGYEDDKFNTDVTAAIVKIENYLRKHLA